MRAPEFLYKEFLFPCLNFAYENEMSVMVRGFDRGPSQPWSMVVFMGVKYLSLGRKMNRPPEQI